MTLSHSGARPRVHQFNLILRVRREAVGNWLWVCAVTILIGATLMKFTRIEDVGAIFKALSFALFLLVLVFCGLMGSYLLRLLRANHNRLEFNEEGLFDFASYLQLAFVPMPAIAKIRFCDFWGWDFLVIDFFIGQNPIHKKRGLSADIYRAMFGYRLWIPLHFFKVSKIDLESQLIHLDRILQDKSQSKEATQKSPENPFEVLQGAPVVVKGSKSKNKARPSLLDRAAKLDQDSPPPLTQITSERSQVMFEVDQIKRKVRETGFDSLVASLYLDYVSMFPALAAGAPDGLPPGLTGVIGEQQGADYEEVRFRFVDRDFVFGIRRDIGASDEALLTVGLDGRLRMTLKVRVEIGELVPLDLESFLPGGWQEDVLRLKVAIDQHEASRLGQGVEMTDPNIFAKSETATRTSLEDLKNRFGLKGE